MNTLSIVVLCIFAACANAKPSGIIGNSLIGPSGAIATGIGPGVLAAPGIISPLGARVAIGSPLLGTSAITTGIASTAITGAIAAPGIAPLTTIAGPGTIIAGPAPLGLGLGLRTIAAPGLIAKAW